MGFGASRDPPAVVSGHPRGVESNPRAIPPRIEDSDLLAGDVAVLWLFALTQKTDALSLNQATRWVMNKEEHATRIQHTIAQYFLTQRVKAKGAGTPEWNDYATRLADHHAVMVAAMKTKQTTDPAAVDALRAAIENGR